MNAFLAPPPGASLRATTLLPTRIVSPSLVARPHVLRRRAAPRALLSRSMPWIPQPPSSCARQEQQQEEQQQLQPPQVLGREQQQRARAARSRRPALVLLVWLAAMARRASRARKAPGMRLVRAGASLALAAVGLAVSRGALSLSTTPLAMVAAGAGSGSGATATAAAPAAVAQPLYAIGRAIAGLVPEGMRVFARPFTEAFGVVFLSEFGDKSMFATALMAMKHSPVLVLLGALLALTVMTLIACFLGQLMHLLPATVTHYSTIALFVFFGLQMIWQSRSLPDKPGGTGGEREGAEELVASASGNSGGSFGVFAKISSLIFVAEWCDRSMLATMALAATSNTAAVIGGATMANVLCTGVAVGSAALVSSRISERLVALVAGILFEFFAVFTFLEGPEGQ